MNNYVTEYNLKKTLEELDIKIKNLFDEHTKEFNETINRINDAMGNIIKEIKELKAKAYVSMFSPEECSLIAQQFAILFKPLGEVISELGRRGIMSEVTFDTKTGMFNITLYHIKKEEFEK